MGLSSSQGRLLTLTARMTSNEYESQQISNAKMRLATQSQEASQDYISALNAEQFNFISFDSNGSQISTPLTANAMYEYNDSKNQYILSNSAGKALIRAEDARNYETSDTLEDFLSKYGLKKIFKSESLESAYENVRVLMGHVDVSGDYNPNVYDKDKDWKTKYEEIAREVKNSYTREAWASDKNLAQLDYLDKKAVYESEYAQQLAGYEVSNDDIEEKQTAMEEARDKFLPIVSYESAIENIIKDICEGNDYSSIDPADRNNYQNCVSSNQGKLAEEIYSNYQDYKTALTLYNDELDNEGVAPSSAYEWDDKTKAQWYTNLWYKINGSSTANMHTNNFIKMDEKMLNSSSWVSYAIMKGSANIESVTYTGQGMTLKDESDPFIFNLNGIKWDTKIYSTCPDIIAADDDKQIAQAEAEYQRRTAEINAKDEKYQRKLNLLDAEHHAMQTEYESVKSALDKNIGRSFKTFQG